LGPGAAFTGSGRPSSVSSPGSLDAAVVGAGGGGVVVDGAWVGWNLAFPPVLKTEPKPGRLAVLNLEPVEGNLGAEVDGSSVVVVSGRLGNVVLLVGRSVRTWMRAGLWVVVGSGVVVGAGDSILICESLGGRVGSTKIDSCS